MAVLHVRNIPESLYERMQSLAQERGITLSALVVLMMEKEAEEAAARRKHARAMRQIRGALRHRPPRPAGELTGELLREARDERERELTREHD